MEGKREKREGERWLICKMNQKFFFKKIGMVPLGVDPLCHQSLIWLPERI